MLKYVGKGKIFYLLFQELGSHKEQPVELRKFLAIKTLEKLASDMVYSWNNIKPPTQPGERNPVIEQGMAKVLRMGCYGKNDQDFRFCKYCGTQAGEGCPEGLGERVLGTTQVIEIYEEEIQREKVRFF